MSIRVAADIDETIDLLKKTVEKHDDVKLTIDTHLPPVLLDADVTGFETIVVSYFTVNLGLCLANFRMCLTCVETSKDIFTDLEGSAVTH